MQFKTNNKKTMWHELVGGFNPSEQICSLNDQIFPNFRGENKTPP